MKALTHCTHGDGNPVCPPSKVLCRQHFDALSLQFEALSTRIAPAVPYPHPSKYTFIGNLKNGESIYYRPGQWFAIEKDHHHLVEASDKELEEIYGLYPHLKPS